MNYLSHFVLFVAILNGDFRCSLQSAARDESYYTAGVVEFRRSDAVGLDAAQHLQDNLAAYLRIIASPAAAATDILVFPESTLNNQGPPTYVPDAAAGVSPCDDSTSQCHDFLRAISCQAKNTSKYVVINLTEREVCSRGPHDPRPCAASGLNLYNTNVVFDRKGRVVSRYRKQHLYGEARNTTYTPEFGIFDTDFGVRFGHFVCFDILFYTPAQEMVVSKGVRDFIVTTMWFGQLPFLTGAQIQVAWSYANDVNLLAAGASNPAAGVTGTGIYSGRRQPLVAVMSRRVGVRQLYVARLPKHPRTERSSTAKRQTVMKTSRTVSASFTRSDIFLKRDRVENYETQLVNLTQGNQLQQRLCYSDTFCCSFELSWRHVGGQLSAVGGHHYVYRLGAYDGRRNALAAESNHIKNCALFACVGDDIADCGRLWEAATDRRRTQVLFDRILIEAHMPKAPRYLLMPNSLRAQTLLPVSASEFEWQVSDEGDMQRVRFLLNSTVADLLTFSIYGNYYEGRMFKDHFPGDSKDGAAITSAGKTFLALLFVGLTVVFDR